MPAPLASKAVTANTTDTPAIQTLPVPDTNTSPPVSEAAPHHNTNANEILASQSTPIPEADPITIPETDPITIPETDPITIPDTGPLGTVVEDQDATKAANDDTASGNAAPDDAGAAGSSGQVGVGVDILSQIGDVQWPDWLQKYTAKLMKVSGPAELTDIIRNLALLDMHLGFPSGHVSGSVT